MKYVRITDIPLGAGRAPHGARGLKLRKEVQAILEASRAPHGARGLKCIQLPRRYHRARRAPHGARGLKMNGCRAPHGARGLKYTPVVIDFEPLVAPPTGRVG